MQPSARSDAPARRVWALVDRIPRWIREILLVGLIYGAYEFSRGVHQGTVTSAMRNGRLLLHWEHLVHLDPESALSHALNHDAWLAVPAAYFYSTLHYLVTPAVLVWLYLKNYRVYQPARTALVVSTVVGLLGFYFLPTAPPRLLVGAGIPDVLYDVRNWGWWGGDGSAPRGLGQLTNQFAAMPSMHVGWALWCGVLLVRYSRRTWLRVLGAIYPVLTTLVVLSTGNHYLLDVLAGAAVMGVGYLAALAWQAGGRRLTATRARRIARRAAATPALAPPDRSELLVQDERVDRARPGLAQQRRGDGEGEPASHRVVDQQHRT